MTANNDLKKIKELIEIVNNKIGKLETHISTHSATLHLIKDQQSVMNEKLDGFKDSIEELDKKADIILEFAEAVDETVEETQKRLSKIEKIPAIAHALSK